MQSQGGINERLFHHRLTVLAKRQWEQLNPNQKSMAMRWWKILTYKWQWQIALNASFILLWVLDRSIPSVHAFDVTVIHSLPIPAWTKEWMGFN